MRSSIRFTLRSSMAALAIAAAGVSSAALAQTATVASADEADAPAEAEIVVTGSSLKGVAPVGSNLTTVGREQLEDLGVQTVQQVLKTVPSIVGSNTAGQGGFGSFDGAGTNAPTIHSLGASASNSTLILLNGHRLPVGGVNHVLADPNIVSPMGLERVEVLADGASSVYGSDAVAGVVNFITRRNVNGFEFNAQKGFGKNYSTFNAGAVAGKTWDTGSAFISYNYSNRSNLAAGDRAFTVADHRAQGGTNRQTLTSCSPATITTGGLVYFSPYAAGTGVTAAQAAIDAASKASCDVRALWDIVPSEVRHNAMVSLQQEVGDSLKLTADAIYSNRRTSQNVTRGQLTGTIYGSGAPVGNSNNPFFVAPAGTGATSETINFDADTLLGAGAHIDGTAETLYGRLDADYAITDAVNLNLGMVYGRDRSRVANIGQLCGSCANLALNGKQSASLGGVPTTVNLVLTAANALDPFGGSTSAATKAYLTDSYQFTQSIQRLTNFYGKIDGDLFDLPGGAAKLAVGGEYTRYALSQDKVSPTNLGPSSTNSAFLHLDYKRTVSSAYGELYLPIVGPDQDIPGVYKFDLNLSGRIDHYSDFGTTKNPKIAANWEMVEGVKVRGNWGRSFVAPALTSRGANQYGQTAESTFGNASPGLASFTVPYASFPSAALIPTCPALPATSCTFATATVAGASIAGGNANLKPQRGTAWSVGVDITPPTIQGLKVSLTYWNNKLRGGITAPAPSLAIASSDLASLLQIYPAGATAAQLAAAGAGLPAGAALPTTPVYFIYNFQQNNVVNLNVAGFDFDANYRYDAGNAGKFNMGFGFTKKTKFEAFNGAGGVKFNALGAAGIFTTFQAIRLEGRANLGWQYDDINANIFVSHTGGYWDRGLGGTDLSQNPVIRTNGVVTGGGLWVKSFTSVDLNLSYKLKGVGFLNEAQLFVDATNLFDKAPSFANTYSINGGSGYDNLNANPIGRVITVGIRTKF